VALNRRNVEVDIAAKGISCVPRVIRVIDRRKHEALPGMGKNKFLSAYSGSNIHVSKNNCFRLGAKCAP
jgi:hypothetical protein